MRLDEFNKYDKNTKKALIRLGVYSMLERSGYDMTEAEHKKKKANRKPLPILNDYDEFDD